MAKKRANGEGNIRKRKDGRWEGRYTAGYDEKTGKQLIKNVLGKTQAEVKEKLAKAVAEAGTVDVRRADEYTLGTWLQTWYELYAKPHLRFSTAEYYRHGIELHIVPRIGDIPLKLNTSRVVIANILPDHLNKLVLAGEPSAVIAFPFQDAPEALHRAVVNAMRHAGHTLRHARLHKLVVEGTVGVLKTSVAVEQRMRVRIGLRSLVEGFENQWVIVVFTEHVGHDAPVAEV